MFSFSCPSSSASSRCPGVRSGCPSFTARLVAALMASRLLLVSSASTCGYSSSQLGVGDTARIDLINVHKVESIPLKAMIARAAATRPPASYAAPMADVRNPSPEYVAFWRESHLSTLTTPARTARRTWSRCA